MTMYRINVNWQNWPGAPGVTTFFQDPAVAQPNPQAIQTFFEAIKGFLPSGLTVQTQSSGDLIEEDRGTLAGTWSASPGVTGSVGTGAGNYAGNAGAVVHWLTSTVVKTRRLRGRSFLVPLINTAYDTGGSLATTASNTIVVAANAMINATPGHFVVWNRPVKLKGQPVTTIGSKGAVTGVRVPDLAVSLRSRRV